MPVIPGVYYLRIRLNQAVVLDYTYYRVGNRRCIKTKKKKNNLFSNEEAKRRGLTASIKQQ